jgi:hypothetical protein
MKAFIISENSCEINLITATNYIELLLSTNHSVVDPVSYILA